MMKGVKFAWCHIMVEGKEYGYHSGSKEGCKLQYDLIQQNEGYKCILHFIDVKLFDIRCRVRIKSCQGLDDRSVPGRPRTALKPL